MLMVPFVAFLVSESLRLSGFLVLMWTAFILSIYGIPNIESSKAQNLKDMLQSISYISKILCFLLMGCVLPLHLANTETTLLFETIGYSIVFLFIAGAISSLLGVKLANSAYRTMTCNSNAILQTDSE